MIDMAYQAIYALQSTNESCFEFQKPSWAQLIAGRKRFAVVFQKLPTPLTPGLLRNTRERTTPEEFPQCTAAWLQSSQP